jgi:hypothetical protein
MGSAESQGSVMNFQLTREQTEAIAWGREFAHSLKYALSAIDEGKAFLSLGIAAEVSSKSVCTKSDVFSGLSVFQVFHERLSADATPGIVIDSKRPSRRGN